MRVGPFRTRSLSKHTLPGVVLVLSCSAMNTHAATASGIAQGPSQLAAVESKAAEAVKESAIVGRLKAKLAARHLSTLVTVRVTTDDDGIVWLSGTVPTIDASAQAARLAMETEGVVAVHNGIVVR
jgi:osmotically-inducible protein OsmY